MRLVSWNLAHQCREDLIPSSFFEAIKLLAPDVLSLNEYVHGSSRTYLSERLHELGLPYLQVSRRVNGHNQVLVASRYPLESGDLAGPATENRGGESNFLHVRIQQANLEFVGIRAPAYTGVALTNYWVNLLNIISTCKNRRIVFMGDFNTDPDQLRRTTAKYLLELRKEGWKIPTPEGEWSFISKSGSGTRIDHAVASQDIDVSDARYVAHLGSVTLAAPNRANAVSDHAPLVLDVSVGAA